MWLSNLSTRWITFCDWEGKRLNNKLFGQITKEIGEDLIYAQESILNEIQFFVNKQVNRFSQIGKVQKIEIFEKTASQKIKRYLYNLKKGNEVSSDKK